MISVLINTVIKNINFSIICCNDYPCFKYKYDSHSIIHDEIYKCKLHGKFICDVNDKKDFMKIPKWCGFNGSLKDIRSIING